MDAFKDALKKKIDQLKASGGKPSVELEIGDEGDSEDSDLNRSPDMAPQLKGSEVKGPEGDLNAGESEIDLSKMSPEDMQKILEALSDKGPLGRPSQGLSERVGQDAKAKMASMLGKK